MGQWMQLVGVVTALIAGVIATRVNYRHRVSLENEDARPRRTREGGGYERTRIEEAT